MFSVMLSLSALRSNRSTLPTYAPCNDCRSGAGCLRSTLPSEDAVLIIGSGDVVRGMITGSSSFFQVIQVILFSVECSRGFLCGGGNGRGFTPPVSFGDRAGG